MARVEVHDHDGAAHIQAGEIGQLAPAHPDERSVHPLSGQVLRGNGVDQQRGQRQDPLPDRQARGGLAQDRDLETDPVHHFGPGPGEPLPDIGRGPVVPSAAHPPVTGAGQIEHAGAQVGPGRSGSGPLAHEQNQEQPDDELRDCLHVN